MSRVRHCALLAAVLLLAAGLTACSSQADQASDTGGGDSAAISVEHAFGTTTLEEEPERVATVGFGNHEVPLALGVVPVGMAKTTFGDKDGDGMMPWVTQRLQELGADTPVLFDQTDGIPFEAVADTDPDVILAAYSGITQEDYDTLSKIAPVVAYPENPWGADWRQVIEKNSAGMGMAEEGQQLVEDLEQQIAETTAKYPQTQGKTAMFLTHVDPTDLSEVSFYTTHDTRVKFLEDIGLQQPPSIVEASADTDSYSGTVSAEKADAFSDVDIIVTFGGQELISSLKSDSLLSQIPAVKNDAIVSLSSGTAIDNASNPMALAIPWVLDEYMQRLSEAAEKAE